MINAVFPKKLKAGSHVRVIAPSRTFKIISEETRKTALARFEEMGIKVTYSKHADESDIFISSSVESRIEDLHEAFADTSVDAIFTAIGGFSANELLDYIDYDLIRKNPKIFCGFSDITVLSNAIYAKTGLVTYSGVHFSTLGMEKGCEYIIEYMKKCLMEEEAFDVKASLKWSDDLWFLDQNKREFIKNDGYVVINQGKTLEVSGNIIGGNMTLMCMLKGTQYMPSLENSILFLEDCSPSSAVEFNRNLQSLIHLPQFKGVKAIVIGRFQKEMKMTMDMLKQMIATKKELQNIPVVAGFDFGHTTPFFSFPIGGKARLNLNNGINLEILEH